MSFALLLTVALVCLGTFFVLIAALGVVRLKDLLMRMHASSKASTLGAICILAAVAIQFGDAAVTARVALICAFLLATAPVAAHTIARAAYRRGIELDPETVCDELGEDRRRKNERSPDRH